MSLEDELEIAQVEEEEVMLEMAYMADAGVSIEMPTGKSQDLPLCPTTQAELLRSSFRKAFELSQRVEIKGLLDAGCFAPVDGDKLSTAEISSPQDGYRRTEGMSKGTV